MHSLRITLWIGERMTKVQGWDMRRQKEMTLIEAFKILSDAVQTSEQYDAWLEIYQFMEKKGII